MIVAPGYSCWITKQLDGVEPRPRNCKRSLRVTEELGDAEIRLCPRKRSFDVSEDLGDIGIRPYKRQRTCVSVMSRRARDLAELPLFGAGTSTDLVVAESPNAKLAKPATDGSCITWLRARDATIEFSHEHLSAYAKRYGITEAGARLARRRTRKASITWITETCEFARYNPTTIVVALRMFERLFAAWFVHMQMVSLVSSVAISLAALQYEDRVALMNAGDWVAAGENAFTREMFCVAQRMAFEVFQYRLMRVHPAHFYTESELTADEYTRAIEITFIALADPVLARMRAEQLAVLVLQHMNITRDYLAQLTHRTRKCRHASLLLSCVQFYESKERRRSGALTANQPIVVL